MLLQHFAALPPHPAIILGGGSAFGRTLAENLAQAGVPVARCLRPGHNLNHEETGLTLNDRASLAADLYLDPEDKRYTPETLPERCRERFGKDVRYLIDLLHSRFESLLAKAEPKDIENWAAVDIALRARCLRAISRTMLLNRSGRAIFISSTAAERPGHGQAYYAAAKLAGEALYRSLGLEMAGRGVSACSVRLGLMDTGRGRQFLEARGKNQNMPTDGLVRIEDAVELIMFLLTPAASAINASTITMDLGRNTVKQL